MNIIERAAKQLSSNPSSTVANKFANPPPTVVDKFAEQIKTGTAATSFNGVEPAALSVQAPLSPPIIETSSLPREGRRVLQLDEDRLRAMGFALPDDQTTLAEEFRLIKRPLLDIARGYTKPNGANEGSGNLIMVTSANPNEGKTFVAINLALSMASEHELHVLLIDADMARPSIPGVLNFDVEAGLGDVLAGGSIDLSQAMMRTSIPNLTILPYGRTRPGSTELLASSRMAAFVDEISRRYSDRIIIFDSPPVLVRSEPLVLAKHVGQVVFVVEAERTSRADIDEAIGLIGRERIGGIVFNKASSMPVHTGFGRHSSYYGK